MSAGLSRASINYIRKREERINVDIKIIANKISKYQIQYKCPFCNQVHCYGSRGDLTNREEDRISHCVIQKGGVYIQITDKTERI